MAFKASDGHVFPTQQRAMKYQASLMADKAKEDIAGAPGGHSWDHDVRFHGPPREVHQVYDGPGRWKVTAKFADGKEHQSVHPESFRAHQVVGTLLGHDQPPPGVQTQQRARAHPAGPKEAERLDREDKRVVGDDEDDGR